MSIGERRNNPFLIEFFKTGIPADGYINVAELKHSVPFEVKRIFWTYYTPENVIRGRHAHFKTEQILVAVAGKITVSTQLPGEQTQKWILDDPSLGLYLPPQAWHTMQYSHNAVQLVLASTNFDEADYIRSFEDFKSIYKV